MRTKPTQKKGKQSGHYFVFVAYVSLWIPTIFLLWRPATWARLGAFMDSFTAFSTKNHLANFLFVDLFQDFPSLEGHGFSLRYTELLASVGYCFIEAPNRADYLQATAPSAAAFKLIPYQLAFLAQESSG